MIQDRIMYAELRPMLLDRSISTDDGCRKMSQRDQILIIKSELEKKKNQLYSEGRLNEFPFGFKLIYCTPRSVSKECMRQELQACLNLKVSFPEIICGRPVPLASEELILNEWRQVSILLEQRIGLTQSGTTEMSYWLSKKPARAYRSLYRSCSTPEKRCWILEARKI